MFIYKINEKWSLMYDFVTEICTCVQRSLTKVLLLSASKKIKVQSLIINVHFSVMRGSTENKTLHKYEQKKIFLGLQKNLIGSQKT